MRGMLGELAALKGVRLPARTGVAVKLVALDDCIVPGGDTPTGSC